MLKQKLDRPMKRRAIVRPVKMTTDAVVILQKRFGSPESEAYMVEELERILIGNQIYDLRTKAKMSQSALARKVGTKAAEIDRLENADYEGHPLPLLRKIAAVVGMRIELNFVPEKKEKRKTKQHNS
jgi:ribosome-binding protein aMBF1 (putative translation factor)